MVTWDPLMTDRYDCIHFPQHWRAIIIFPAFWSSASLGMINNWAVQWSTLAVKINSLRSQHYIEEKAVFSTANMYFPIIPNWLSVIFSTNAPLLWTWYLTAQGPPASDICWPRLETCWNLFTWGHLVGKTGDLFILVHLRTPFPLVLTSGSYWSMYNWQAAGAHHPRMLSC